MLTKDQILEAVAQVKVVCELKMSEYQMVSLRSALYECGYTQEQADQVITFCAEAGFTNCIDPMIPVKNVIGIDKPVYPCEDVCYWGPDQLRSRLSFIC
jgi:hypothetical protein